MQGDVARTQKLMFIPHDGSGVPVSPFSNINMDSTAVDDYLMKTAGLAYGNSSTELGIVAGSGLGGKGFMEGGAGIQYRGSVRTYTQYIARIIETINRRFLKAPWAKVKWKGLEPEEDVLKTAQVEQARIASGVWAVEYVQDQIGYPKDKYAKPEPPPPPAPAPMAPAPTANPSQRDSVQFQPTKPAVKVAPDFGKVYQRAMEAELLVWRDKERFWNSKNLSRGVFKSDVIPAELMKSISAECSAATTREQIDGIFRAAIENAKKQPLEKIDQPDRVVEVLAALDKIFEMTK
jgi:hypothetical protein